jgi:hypothetical protein
MFKKVIKDSIKKEPNYRAVYILEIIWVPIGVVFMISVNPAIGISFLGLGTVYLAIGISNTDKWNKEQ